jgi:hypothetical protein
VLILSRKPGESIVFGIASFAATAGPGPMPPVPRGGGPSGGGGTGPAPCPAVATDSGPTVGRRGRTDSGWAGDRPPIECGDRGLAD